MFDLQHNPINRWQWPTWPNKLNQWPTWPITRYTDFVNTLINYVFIPNILSHQARYKLIASTLSVFHLFFFLWLQQDLGFLVDTVHRLFTNRLTGQLQHRNAFTNVGHKPHMVSGVTNVTCDSWPLSYLYQTGLLPQTSLLNSNYPREQICLFYMLQQQMKGSQYAPFVLTLTSILLGAEMWQVWTCQISAPKSPIDRAIWPKTSY